MSAIFEGHEPKWPQPTVNEDLFIDKDSFESAKKFLANSIAEANKKRRSKR